MLGFWLFQIQRRPRVSNSQVRNPEGLTGPFSRRPDGLNDWVAAQQQQQFASAEDARPRHGACAGTGTWWMLRGQHVLRVSLCAVHVAASIASRPRRNKGKWPT